jgi:tetratricopeptide (TPR) repeat protein
VALVLAGALVACRTVPPAFERVPDPLRPPVPPPILTKDAQAAARGAVAAAERGEVARAEKLARSLPADHPVSALVALELRHLRGEDVAKDAAALAQRVPGYGSAWGLSAVAFQLAGELRAALLATRRAAELQPEAEWPRVAAALEVRYTGSRLALGRAELEAGRGDAALQIAHEVLAVVPSSVEARMLVARTLVARGTFREAAELVPGLPDTAAGLELKGTVAEGLGQWDIALELYGRLPASDTRRCELVRRAQRALRLTDAPPYLSRALKATQINRASLAAILAWEATGLAARATGAVPVFEDIVQLPERGDILLVARANVIPGDAVERRFSPNRTVSAREFAAVMARLAKALDRPAPSWCNGSKESCLQVADPLDGGTAAGLVAKVAGGEEEPCTPH